MDERVLRKSLLWSVILVLAAILWIAVSPCLAAESSYTLQELFDGQSIEIDNLVFDNFDRVKALPDDPDYEQINVEKVGAGTDSPGLRFTPNPDSSTPPWSLDDQGFQVVEFTFDVRRVNDGPLIMGSGLILEPGNVITLVEGKTKVSAVKVEDMGTVGATDKYWVERRSEISSSGVNTIDGSLQAETKFPEQAKVLPHIVVGVTVLAPGGESSIKSFQYRVSLVPVEGRPIADAGPDSPPVFDTVELDGSASEGNIDSYNWELVPRDETLQKLTAEGIKPLVEGLGKSLYDVTLTVTDQNGLTHADTAVVAAAGPCEAKVPEPDPATLGDLHLWRLKLKKYKYCNWSIARMVGSFTWPEEFKADNGDCLTGEVTIKVKDNNGDTMGVWSDEIRIKAKKRRHKLVLGNY
jgi:hypothetical protein